jgi:hypothetical protein
MNKFVGPGFNDWKNPSYITQHENSEKHRDCLMDLFTRKTVLGRIDTQLELQYLDRRNYWRSVLHRVVSVIGFLSERGLAFRGTDETVGSSNNGNYLGVLELISKFDPFLAQHINEHANQGRGHTSYLSKNICEEFIAVMATKVLSTIVAEIVASRYFSVSVDSTPDMSNIDQLTIIVRCVSMTTYEPVERFLTFIEISSHTGENLANTLLGVFSKAWH